MLKPAVVFVTVHFDETPNGPATFARYLWDAFKDDPDLEFHLVGKGKSMEHPRLHNIGDVPQGEIYAATTRTALELRRKLGERALFHSNVAFANAGLLEGGAPVIGQINDYDAADIASRTLYKLRRYGPRQVASWAWRHARERRMVRDQTCTVCNSEFTREKVLARYRPRNEASVAMIYKGVDVGFFRRPEGMARPDDAETFKMLYIGNFWRLKGLDTLLQALERLPGRFRLKAAGIGEHRYRAEVEPMVRRMGVEDRFTNLGLLSREGVRETMWSSDLLVTNPDSEALGVSNMEAMASGLPVVCAQVGGVPEVITHGETGLMIPPRNPSALAEAISGLSENKELRAKLSAVGPGNAERFGVNKMVARYRELYLDLLQ